MNTEVIFKQRTMAGKKDLVLAETEVVIYGYALFRTHKYVFQLVELDSKVRRLKIWHPKLVLFYVLSAAATASIFRLIIENCIVPYMVAIALGLSVFCPLVFLAIKACFPMDAIVFMNKSGATVFDIVKDKHQASDCEKFIAEISKRISDVQTCTGCDPTHPSSQMPT